MLSKQKICQLARLKDTTKLSMRDIGQTVGCSHQSVIRYSYFIERHALTWSAMENMSKEILIRLFFPNYPYRNTLKIEPDYPHIYKLLMSQRKQTIYNCWLNYISTVGENAIGRTQFYTGYRAFRKAQKLSMKMEHRAGEIAFVDYAGTTAPYELKAKQQTKQAQIFVGILGCSEKMFAYATPGQTTHDWIASQVAMLEAFGGVPEIIVPDNPKALVNRTRPERVLNANYDSFGKHYDVAILPARVRQPQDKSLAEQAVGFITHRILADMKTMTFFSIAEINAYLGSETQKLNNLKFQKRNTTRNIEFEALDKPKLKPLPSKPFELIEKVYNLTVPADYMVLVDEHFYSVPHHYAHKKVEIQVTRHLVKVLYDMQLITSHERKGEPGAFTRLIEHMHPNHRYFDDKALDFYWEWADAFGPATQKIMSLQFISVHKMSRRANIACRAIQALYVSDKMTSADFELACQFALQYCQTSATHLKHIISSKAYAELPEAQTSVLAAHPNVRGSNYYEIENLGGTNHE